MTDPDRTDGAELEEPDKGARYFDVRGSQGAVIGDGNTVTTYIYNDRPTPTPLIEAHDRIEFPYRGLGWFSEHDAPLFFGRDAAIEEVLAQLSTALTDPRIVVLSGVSGAGKSSLIRAGVLPRIRGGDLAAAPTGARWPPCVVFSPGSSPLHDLAIATARAATSAPSTAMTAATLRRELDHDPTAFAAIAAQTNTTPTGAAPDRNRRLLVVVDQFERVFTQCTDVRLRQNFVAALHAAATIPDTETGAPAALVILVVRADFEARCAELECLAEPVQQRYLLTSMTERQLRLAITEPAKRARARVDDELTEQLLREVRTATCPAEDTSDGTVPASGAGVLPLLSDALDRAWRGRAGKTVLTAADYERVGGIEHAVALSAQRTYDELTPDQQAAARKVFVRLAVVGPDGTDTADRARRSELVSIAGEVDDVEAVLEAFAAERLLTLGDDTVEISHEVLLGAWPLLRDEWLADTHTDRVTRTRLRNAATAWDENRRDSSYLLTGSALDAAAAMKARITTEPGRHIPLTDTENLFLADSTRAAGRRVRQRRAFTAVLLLLVIILTVATTVAIRQTAEAEKQTRIAVARELVSRSGLLYATDPEGARLAALAAARIHRSDESVHAMLTAANNQRIALLPGHTSPVTSVAFSPDGRILGTTRADSTVQLWDPSTRRQIGQLRGGHVGALNSLAFSRSSRILATAGSDKTVRLWNPRTGAAIGPPLGHSGSVISLAFSPDDRILASAGSDKTVRLWNPRTGAPIGQPLTGDAGAEWSAVSFSPDGRTLATAGAGTVRLWDLISGRSVLEIPADHADEVTAMAFSPDSRALAIGSGGTTVDGSATVRLWDPITGTPIGTPFTGHTGRVTSVAFSHHGRILAIGGIGGTVRLLDPATGEQIGEPLVGHTGMVMSVAFSPDDHTLATAADDGSTMLWGIDTNPKIDGIVSSSAAFSPDGATLATGSADSSGYTVRLWDPATGKPSGRSFVGHTGLVTSVAFSPDGATLATGSADSSVRLWDPATGEQIGEPPVGHKDKVNEVMFSPDNRVVATASLDQTVRLWDTATRRQIGEPLTGQMGLWHTMAFSPDGRTFASAGLDGVELRDPRTGKPLGESVIPNAGTSVAFSHDSGILAVGGVGGTVQLWNPSTGEQLGRPLVGHIDSVISMAFSPDNRILATASYDNTVRLWDTVTYQQIGDPLPGHSGMDYSVVFSPSGRILATSSLDGTARLLDVSFVTDVAAALCRQGGKAFEDPQWPQDLPDDLRPQLCP